METPSPAELEARELIAGQLDHLEPAAQRRVLERVRNQLNKEVTEKEAQLVLNRYEVDALRDLVNWWETAAKEPKLERNEHSRIHMLKEAAKLGLIRTMDPDRKPSVFVDDGGALQRIEHTFVVKHNWAAAFENADGVDSEEIRLPYPVCSFEFRVSGRSVVAYAFETEEAPGVEFSVLLECHKLWYSFDDLQNDPSGAALGRFVWDQIRSICIALDAEVATHAVVRAPAKLNEKREKAGRSPLPDFMVIDLSRRHRIANPTASSGEGSKKRLHFRRGHWRHYETHKTWIKWCLVGDPALGFIGHRYAL